MGFGFLGKKKKDKKNVFEITDDVMNMQLDGSG